MFGIGWLILQAGLSILVLGSPILEFGWAILGFESLILDSGSLILGFGWPMLELRRPMLEVGWLILGARWLIPGFFWPPITPRGTNRETDRNLFGHGSHGWARIRDGALRDRCYL